MTRPSTRQAPITDALNAEFGGHFTRVRRLDGDLAAPSAVAGVDMEGLAYQFVEALGERERAPYPADLVSGVQGDGVGELGGRTPADVRRVLSP